jgi:chromosomal replication initiation ATPase DnaA
LPFPWQTTAPRSSTPVVIPITVSEDKFKDGGEQLRQRVGDLKEELEALLAKARALEKDIGIASPVSTRRLTTVRDIIHTTAEYFKIPTSEFYSNRRHTCVVRARRIAMYLAKALTAHSLPAIGRRFGGRDHTTVLDAWDKIAEKRKVDTELNRQLDELVTIIAGAPNASL